MNFEKGDKVICIKEYSFNGIIKFNKNSIYEVIDCVKHNTYIWVNISNGENSKWFIFYNSSPNHNNFVLYNDWLVEWRNKRIKQILEDEI